MKVVGLVTEYNPFHNGHLYHMKKSLEVSHSDFSVAVMSGNFLQRGEPALVDKWTRAKMAIDAGVDLVIELPVVYACQSAEYFAHGAVSILDALGVVDSISFGSECGDINFLTEIAEILVKEPPAFKLNLKKYLDEGMTYPKARNNALFDIIVSSNKNVDSDFLSNELNSPNNILAIEYLKALIKLKSSIKPYTINRINNDFNQKELSGDISSATSIRETIFNEGHIADVDLAIPDSTSKHLHSFLNEFKEFNRIEMFNQILNYKLRTMKPNYLKKFNYISEGLENRIIKYANQHSNVIDVMDCVKTKRYTYTRIQRIFMNMLLDIDSVTFSTLFEKGPFYIRVLAANQNGIKILSKAKKISKVPILTKFAAHKDLNCELANSLAEIENRATNIYFSAFTKIKTSANKDYYISPYITKK